MRQVSRGVRFSSSLMPRASSASTQMQGDAPHGGAAAQESRRGPRGRRCLFRLGALRLWSLGHDLQARAAHHRVCRPQVHRVVQRGGLAYRFLPAYRGQGLATEAPRACVRYAFERLDLERVEAFVLPANAASVRVLDKLAMKPMPAVMYDDQSALRYGIDRVDFREACAIATTSP